MKIAKRVLGFAIVVTLVGLPMVAFAGLPICAAPAVGTVILGILIQW